MDRKPRTPEEILEYRKRWFRLTGIIAVTMWLGWFILAVLLAFFKADEPIARFGQVGDAFGSLNAIFGGAGFLGLLYTIYRQHLDTLEAEQRRRDDKKEEETARLESDRLRREDRERQDTARRDEQERHKETISAQERIARISSYTSLLNSYQQSLTALRAKADMLMRLYNSYYELAGLFGKAGEGEFETKVNNLVAESIAHLEPEEHNEVFDLNISFHSTRSAAQKAKKEDTSKFPDAHMRYQEQFREITEYLLKLDSNTSAQVEGTLALIEDYRELLSDETTTSKNAEEVFPSPAAE